MKRIFFAILIMFMLLPSTTFATQMSSNELLNLAFVTPTDGNNWDNYIRVSTASDLKRISNDLSANYYLANDIIFTDADFKKGGLFYNNGAGWTGFGTSDVPFLGIFDGNNHKISGICFNIQSSDNAYCGMFRYNKGTIKNLTIDKVIAVADNFQYGLHLGGIVGYNKGSVINCHNESDLIISLNSTSDSCCYYVGGICGLMDNSTSVLRNCSNYGDIIINAAGRTIQVGGICGAAWGGNINSAFIDNCYNHGRVIVKSSNDSTLPGWASREYSAFSGGIVGCLTGGINKVEYLKISNCINYGEISTESDCLPAYAGGIAGIDYTSYAKSIIKDCENKGNVRASSNDYAYAGGITSSSDNQISDCSNSGIISSNAVKFSYIGGIAGNGGNIMNSSNKGDINCHNDYFDSKSSYIGGVAGVADNIQNCHNVGHIATESNDVACGGVVGSCSNISSCSNIGGIYCLSNNITLGGIVGLENGTLSNSYNHGDVMINSDSDTDLNIFLGGYIGKNTDGNVINVYNSGNIATTSSYGYLGGIAGYSDGTLSGGYYIDTFDKGIGVGNGSVFSCSTTQLKNKDSFFDFDSIWDISVDKNMGYPYLQCYSKTELPTYFTISYDTNGGNADIKQQVKKYDETINLTAIIPKKERCKFVGWASKPNTAVAEYPSNAEYSNNKDITLYAAWEELPFTTINIETYSKFDFIKINVFTLDVGCTVLLAVYKDEKLINFQKEIYNGETIPFIEDSDYDTVKIMVWNSMAGMQPLCNVTTEIK